MAQVRKWIRCAGLIEELPDYDIRLFYYYTMQNCSFQQSPVEKPN